MILPNSLSILGKAFPADKKARAVGIRSAAAAVFSGVAPAIAGATLDHSSWRIAFLMFLPVVVRALAAGALWLPSTPRTSDAPVDVGGAAMSTFGLGGLGAALINLPLPRSCSRRLTQITPERALASIAQSIRR